MLSCEKKYHHKLRLSNTIRRICKSELGGQDVYLRGEHGQARRGRRMIGKSERGWRRRETENFPTQYLTVKVVTLL